VAKVYSIQPRFVKGVAHAEGWAWVDFLLSTYRKTNLPAYGSWTRDVYLAEVWKAEPITAGIFNAYMERLQTRQWKVTGGKISASRAARLLHESEGGEGLSRLLGLAGGDFIFTDKGFFGEKARRRKNSTFGPVLGLQHLDSTRLVRNYDRKEKRSGWYYLPDEDKAVLVPDENLLRIIPAPSGRDRFRGLGYCAMSRLYDALEMMIGFLQYYRQKIGNLPPEIIAIFNNMTEEQIKQAYQSYLQRRTAENSDFYPGVMTLGSDDPSNPVKVDIVSLTGLPESFSWMNFQEWWVKAVSLNVGEASGEFWLLQHAGIGQKGYEVQAQVARGRGTGSFAYQFETKINTDVMPNGVTFKFDAKDDEQDRERAEILGRNVATIERMAKAGAERMDFVFTVGEIRQTAIDIGVLDPEIAGEDVPTVLGAILKSAARQEVVTITSNYEVIPARPLLTGKTADRARELYELLEGWYVPAFEAAPASVESG
jgi:hypothetical protein